MVNTMVSCKFSLKPIQSLQERLVESWSVLQALSFSGNGYYLATGQGNQGLGMWVSGCGYDSPVVSTILGEILPENLPENLLKCAFLTHF